MGITKPLREEHKTLLSAIEDIGILAESVNMLSQTELRKKLKLTLNFLQKQLIPHALAEDEVLYPKIEELARFKKAMDAMRYDHLEIAKLTRALAKDSNNKSHIQKLLYQLSVLIVLHFKKEEEIYLPFLDGKLDRKDAESLFRQMEVTAARIKAKNN